MPPVALLILAALSTGVAACTMAPASTLDDLAADYLALVTEADRIDDDLLDEPRTEGHEAAPPADRASVARRADALAEAMDRWLTEPPEAARRSDRRARVLAAMTRAVAALLREPEGGRRFDEDAARIFGLTVPPYDPDETARLRATLETLLPGEAPLEARLERFQRRFVVASDRVAAVLERAVAECRTRTRPHVDLPPEEIVKLAYVRQRPWSAFNRYEGGYRSRVEVNLDFPLRLDAALDLACHETYPGHHLQRVVTERDLVRRLGWREYSVEQLFAPPTTIAEGAAQAAAALAFPGVERVAFEREVLFPLAGLSPDDADLVDQVRQVTLQLSLATVHGLRQYLDGRASRQDAARWLRGEVAMPDPEPLLAFADRYGAYVATYTLGWSIVQAHLDRAEAERGLDGAWTAMVALLPRTTTPDDLDEERQP
jgi:hypothetical protein